MGRFLGNVVKWFLWAIGLVVILSLIFGWNLFGLIPSRVIEVPAKCDECEVCTKCPVCEVCADPANSAVQEPDVYNTFGDLGKFYRNVDEEVVGYHQQGAVMQYTCKLGEIGVYLSIDKANTVMGEANDNEVVAYIPCQSNGSAITATTVHWSGSFQRAHWVVVTKELPMTPLEALMLLKAEEQNREALFFNADGTSDSY